MKRDMDLVRQILFWAEDQNERDLMRTVVQLEGWDEDTVFRHIRLMGEAGLIISNIADYHEYGLIGDARVVRITWEGYEFLDAVRSDTVWNKTKSMITGSNLGVSMQILRYVVPALVKERLGLQQVPE